MNEQSKKREKLKRKKSTPIKQKLYILYVIIDNRKTIQESMTLLEYEYALDMHTNTT